MGSDIKASASKDSFKPSLLFSKSRSESKNKVSLKTSFKKNSNNCSEESMELDCRQREEFMKVLGDEDTDNSDVYTIPTRRMKDWVNADYFTNSLRSSNSGAKNSLRNIFESTNFTEVQEDKENQGIVSNSNITSKGDPNKDFALSTMLKVKSVVDRNHKLSNFSFNTHPSHNDSNVAQEKSVATAPFTQSPSTACSIEIRRKEDQTDIYKNQLNDSLELINRLNNEINRLSNLNNLSVARIKILENQLASHTFEMKANIEVNKRIEELEKLEVSGEQRVNLISQKNELSKTNHSLKKEINRLAKFEEENFALKAKVREYQTLVNGLNKKLSENVKLKEEIVDLELRNVVLADRLEKRKKSESTFNP